MTKSTAWLTRRRLTWRSLVTLGLALACAFVAPAVASSSTSLESGSDGSTAFGGSTSMTCIVDTGSQQRAIECTVTGYSDNLHLVRINNITAGQTFVVSTNQKCSTGGLGGSAELNFRAPTGNKYRVTVSDCAGDKDVYKVDKEGNVTVIHSTIAA